MLSEGQRDRNERLTNAKCIASMSGVTARRQAGMRKIEKTCFFNGDINSTLSVWGGSHLL